MTKEEFEALREEVSSSGRTLKSVLAERGVPYSTYNYWCKKASQEGGTLPMAPISIRERSSETAADGRFMEMEATGVVLAFPNGVRAHFGRGSEPVLREVLNKSLGHVLPE